MAPTFSCFNILISRFYFLFFYDVGREGTGTTERENSYSYFDWLTCHMIYFVYNCYA